MINEQIRRQFSVRYYRWAIREAIEEITLDLPHLRAFRGGVGNLVVRLIDGLPKEQRLPFAIAMVKRWMTDIASDVGDPVTQAERQFEEMYKAGVFRLTTGHRRLFESSNAPNPAVSRRDLRKSIREKLDMVWGRSARGDDKRDIVYLIKYDQWEVITRVGFGGFNNQVDYRHRIRINDECYLYNNINFSHLWELRVRLRGLACLSVI
jgi:hypothetical protein